MAANAAAVRNCMESTLLITDADLRNNFTNVQGFDSFDVGRQMSTDDLTNMCRSIRKPGGTIQNPNQGAGQPARIPNPGIAIGFIHERRLQMMHEEIKCCAKVQRPFDSNASTLARLVQTWRAKEENDNISNDHSPYPPKCTKAEDLRKTMEDMEVWLGSNCGDTKIPLAHVTREHAEVPERRTPPEPDGGYCMPTRKDELIRRAPLNGPAYRADNSKVFAMLKSVFFGTTMWSWIKSHAKSQNGRNAYLALKTHYFGEEFQQRINAAADKVIEYLL